MSKANKRLTTFLEGDAAFNKYVKQQLRRKLKRRRYGHVLSEAAHYLTRAAEYRIEGQLQTAKMYVNGARSILLRGTSWSNQTNYPRPKLP